MILYVHFVNLIETSTSIARNVNIFSILFHYKLYLTLACLIIVQKKRHCCSARRGCGTMYSHFVQYCQKLYPPEHKQTFQSLVELQMNLNSTESLPYPTRNK